MHYHNPKALHPHEGTGSNLSFRKIREGELEVIQKRREAVRQSAANPPSSEPSATQTRVAPDDKTGRQHTNDGSPELTEGDHQDSLSNSLVGIALSGGGVRSGAVSLGFLMELSRTGYLRVVDYLSTVSGGGYAGAVLTAESCRIQRRQHSPEKYDSDFSPLFTHHDHFTKGPDAASQHKALKGLRSLVSRANYLMQNQGWMSRVVLGICAMGTLCFSTVICVCALLALFFRSFYTPETYDYLDALNFRGDLWVPMVPSIFLFLIWVVCWVCSFVRHGSNAQGIAAKYVFFAMMTCIVLGITLIATTGDVQVDEMLAILGVSQATWDEWGSLGSWLKTGAITLIGASLLPYFAPSALLRSGKEQVDLKKRLVFTLARNGLLFGVPLLVFAAISRENLSNWNAQRNSRIETRDLLEVPEFFTSIDHPREAISEWELFVEFQKTVNPEQQSWQWTFHRDFPVGPVTAFLLVSDLQRSARTTAIKKLSYQQKRQLLRAALAQEFWSEEVRQWHQELLDADKTMTAANAGSISPSERNEGTEGSEIHQASRFDRALSLCSSFINWLTGDKAETDFQKIVQNNGKRRRLIRLILHDINRKLIDPEISSEILAILAAIDLPDSPSTPLTGDEKQAYDELITIRNAAQTTADLVRIRQKDDSCIRLFAELHNTASANWQTYSKAPAKLEEQSEGMSFEDRIAASIPSMQPLFHRLPNTESADQSRDETDSGDAQDSNVTTEEIIECLIAGNREILSAVFPTTIRPRTDLTIYSSIVHVKDQQERVSIAKWSFVIFLVAALIFDLNTISWHGYYAQQLGNFWIQAGLGSNASLSVADIASVEVGTPYHLLNACVNFPGKPHHGTNVTQDENPDDFLISSLYCGSDHSQIGYIKTRQSSYANLTLADAIALSGAAVSPWATQNRLVQVLLLILNFRTGLWLPNPRKASGVEKNSFFDRLDAKFFPPLRWLALRFLPHYKHDFRQRPPEDWSHLLVTDGGHYENLGIEPLLKRRCPVIIALDASEDRNYQFEGLATVMNRMRSSEGIDFFQPGTNIHFRFPDALVPDTNGISSQRIVEIEVHYPETNGQLIRGRLFYIKNTLLKTDPLELLKQRKVNNEFPNDATSDQFFSPERFETYRFLGVTSARDLCDLLDKKLNLQYNAPTDSCTKSRDLTLLNNKQFVKAVCDPTSCIETSLTSSASTTATQTPAADSLTTRQITNLLDTLAPELKVLAADTDSVGTDLKQLILQMEFVRRFATKIIGAGQWPPIGSIPASLATLAAADSHKKHREDLLQLLNDFLNISEFMVQDPEDIQSELTKLSQINGISTRCKGLIGKAQKRIAEILASSGQP